jgi:hypothetical protein
VVRLQASSRRAGASRLRPCGTPPGGALFVFEYHARHTSDAVYEMFKGFFE